MEASEIQQLAKHLILFTDALIITYGGTPKMLGKLLQIAMSREIKLTVISKTQIAYQQETSSIKYILCIEEIKQQKSDV